MESIHDSQQIDSRDSPNENHESDDNVSEIDDTDSETGAEENETKNSVDSGNESEDSRDAEYTFGEVCAIVKFYCTQQNKTK